MKYYLLLAAVLLALAITLIFVQKVQVDNLKINYVHTETSGPESFDPVQADSTQNILSMRLLYATPLEISSNNTLTSYILEDFGYDVTASTVRFKLKSNLRFEDGSPLTAQDVATSVARIALLRPEFPVLKRIVGLNKWRLSGLGLTVLPDGISVTNDMIDIRFDRNIANPLFRFALELFSIIPRACIDLTSGSLTCKKPPESGYFKLTNQTSSLMQFEKRADLLDETETGDTSEITVHFKKLDEVCNSPLEKGSIIATSEIALATASCEPNKLGSVGFLPSSRFIILRFNPNVKPFDSRKVRQGVAESFRRKLRKQELGIDVSRSLFSRLLPGYLDDSEFQVLSASAGSFGQLKLPRVNAFGPEVFELLSTSLSEIGFDVATVNGKSVTSSVDGFISGDYPITLGGSGFWAHDPIGDLMMWLTPGLHRNLTYVWNRSEYYNILQNIEVSNDPKYTREQLEVLNKSLVEDSLIAPIASYRRAFIFAGKPPVNLPQAITSPYPWHIVKTTR